MGSNGHVDELIEASWQDLIKRYPGNNRKLYVKVEEGDEGSKIFFYAGTPRYWNWSFTEEVDDTGNPRFKKKMGNFLRSATTPASSGEIEAVIKAYIDENNIPIRVSYN